MQFTTDLGNIESIESFTAGTLLPGTSQVKITEKRSGSAPLGYDEAPADFTVSFRGERTPHLPWNVTRQNLEYDLENLATIGDVTVNDGLPSNSLNGKSWSVTFHTEVGDIPMMTTTSGRLSRPGVYGSVANNNALVNVTQTVSGSAALLAWNGAEAPAIRTFDFTTNIVPDGTYAFKVVAINAVGQGISSLPSTTVVAREGASSAHTTASGTALSLGTTGYVHEVQTLTITGEKERKNCFLFLSTTISSSCCSCSATQIQLECSYLHNFFFFPFFFYFFLFFFFSFFLFFFFSFFLFLFFLLMNSWWP